MTQQRQRRNSTHRPNGRAAVPEAALDPVVAANEAQLRYVSDAMPGITRHQAKNGFDYRLPDGALVRDIETLRRIRSLAIPPAWTELWICLDPNGHLQATGRDARGRKQYRYDPRWRDVRDEAKYHKLLVFARVLPLIRARVEEDLQRPGLTRERVLAAIVRLMELTLFRTWAATHLAAEALREFAQFDSESERKKAIVDVVKKVASHLGNTPAICRRCYIHPAVLDGYLEGRLLAALAERAKAHLVDNIR